MTKDFEAISKKSWQWLLAHMEGVTVHICCQTLPKENPEHIYLYLNRLHQNGEAFRWYLNGLTPDLADIAKDVKADLYSIPAIAKDPKFLNNVIKDQDYKYINHFTVLKENYPILADSYSRKIKELPNTGVAAMLLCNLLPIDKCFVHGMDLYYPHYKDYSINTHGTVPPHSEEFDLSCLDLLDKNKFIVESKNPKVLQKFQPKQYGVSYNDKVRRDALLLISDNTFAVPTTFFINNFIEKNPWFSGDINIIYSGKISPLSQESMDLIKTSGYSKINFVKIEDSREAYIRHVASGFTSKVGYHTRVMPSIFTVESYNHELWGGKYDKTLLLDPDMLVINSLEDIFNIDVPIMVTEDTTFVQPNKDPSRAGTKQFNGGFILVDHRKLKSCEVNISDAIFEFFKTYTKSPRLFEQSIMNDFFECVRNVRLISKIPFDVTFSPDRTQILKRCIPDSYKLHISEDSGRIPENSYERSYNPNISKIIHYVGSKPWQYTNKTFEECYQKVEKLWFTAFEKFYKSCKKFANSSVTREFTQKNPRVTRTLEGDLQYRPSDSVKRVNNLKKEHVLDLFKKEKNYDKGFSLYKRAASKYPTWPALRREFGNFLLRQNRSKDLPKALELYTYAFKANPKSVAAGSGIVTVAIKLRDKKNALVYLKKVQKLSPSSKTTKLLEKNFVAAFTTKKEKSWKTDSYNSKKT